MRHSWLAALPLLLLTAAEAVGQQDFQPPHNQTAPPANARFEIVQSGLAAKWTLRLDRYSGRVWQIVSAAEGGVAWQELEVIGRPAVQNATRARFQIFTSGLAAEHTFMIDTQSGKSWIVVTGKRKAADGSEYEVILWEPFTRW